MLEKIESSEKTLNENFITSHEVAVARPTNESIVIEEATSDELGGIAKLISVQRDRQVSEILPQLQQKLIISQREPAELQIFAATSGGKVVGYGKCEILKTKEIDGCVGMPQAWYLTGSIVAPEYRRLGIGRRLCEARLAWIAKRADAVYYYTNVRNKGSIALHKAFGFVEFSQDFTLPGHTFRRGKGVLFRAELEQAA